MNLSQIKNIMKYHKSLFFLIFIFNLFTIFIFSSQSVSAEIYACKNSEGACYDYRDTADYPAGTNVKGLCEAGCGTIATCVLYNSSAGCVDQTRDAREACEWYRTNDCTKFSLNEGGAKCNEKPRLPYDGSIIDAQSCCCKDITPAPSGINDSMPNWKIPDINLQISIPGLKLTKGSAIKCTEVGGKKTCNFPWIGEYIAGIYKYAIGIVGILAAVVLMVGGVIWIVAGGSATMIGEAKAWIAASLSGLVIALCSYTILYYVNPNLVKFNPLKITIVDQIPIPENIQEFAAKCKPTDTGECAVSKMSIFGDKASEASAICMAESSGNPNVSNKTTKCSNGDYYAVWGLFQFNLSANYFYDANNNKLDCPRAFGNKAWVNSSPSCTVTDVNLYNQCMAAATNASLSISNAKRLAGNSGWGPWEANSKWCNF